MPPAPSPAAEIPVAIPTFVDETQSAGIDSVYAGDWQYMVGGGVATFDCNDDGFADMLLAGGEKPAKFYRNASTRGGPLKFAAEKSGLELDAVTGAYPLDVDSDGITDLVLLRVGENVAMRGLGDCRFERANEAWGFDGGDAWSTALAATWETRRRLADDRHRQLYRPHPGHVALGLLHRQLAAPAAWPTASQRSFAAPLPLKPSYLPAVDAVHRLEPVRHADAFASPTTANTTRAARSRCGASSPASRRCSTPPTRAGSTCASGAWASPATTSTGDGYPDYFLTSMADNKLQTLAAVPAGGQAEAGLRRRRLRQGRHRAPALHGRRLAPEHRLACPVRGREQ